MSGVPIDTLAVARRVLASPDGFRTVTAHEVIALAACTVRESTGRMPDLPAVFAPATPLVNLAGTEVVPAVNPTAEVPNGHA